ncbi:TPA: hypothetical protein ACGW3M_000955 [Pseudomonas aeruginosa]|uniref:hypothetical protein n=1 Tax=Pseudomonas aeruginosa TaxID=287 RepID=UPI0027F5BD16|nr:hypothetical protein [Pseudomonas aeruginosa]ELJ2276227.1 hypothetical protein [Pseudomonas aeruginosa]MBX6653695.1 hypothetical protein [Pseudomonas aeruginosa]
MHQELTNKIWLVRIMSIVLLGVVISPAIIGIMSKREPKPAEIQGATSRVPKPFEMDSDQVVKLGLYGAECVNGKLSYREPQPDGSNSLKTYTIFRDSVDRGMHFGVTEHIRCTTGS